MTKSPIEMDLALHAIDAFEQANDLMEEGAVQANCVLHSRRSISMFKVS